MSRISTCRGCQAREQGIKSRIAIPHTCGLEPMSIKTKLFYAIEDPESPESDEPTIHHKWGKWKKEPIPKILRGAVTGLAVRKCSVCGANQHRTYYRGQKYPSLDIERNGRSDVDCNTFKMTPTYSITEILDFLHLLDLDELTILGELITEEIERYTITQLSIIHTNFAWRVRVLAKKEADRVMEQIWVLN